MKIFKDNYIIGQVLYTDIKKQQLTEFMYGKNDFNGYNIIEYKNNIHDKKNKDLLHAVQTLQLSEALLPKSTISHHKPIFTNS